MIVGVPKEIKQDEYRVSLLPVGAEELTRAGHKVLVERGAGMGSGIPDELYRANGAEIVDSPAEIFGSAQLVIKVKEPQPDEIPPASERPDPVYVFPFCGRRVADSRCARDGDHRRGV